MEALHEVAVTASEQGAVLVGRGEHHLFGSVVGGRSGWVVVEAASAG